MKRIYLAFSLGLMLTLRLDAKMIEGLVIFQDDTIYVTFRVPGKSLREPNYEAMQHRVKYFDSAGRKVILRPSEAEEIRFKYKDTDVRMLSRRIPDLGKRTVGAFLKLEVDGPLTLLSYYGTYRYPEAWDISTDPAGAYAIDTKAYFLQRDAGLLKRVKPLNFRNDLTAYFRDCPALVEKVGNKDFRMRDLAAIVDFYNANCR